MLIDTNIIVFAISETSAKHSRAQEFLQQYVGQGYISHQSINEALRVLTHPKYPNPMMTGAAVEAVMNIAEGYQIIAPTNQSLYIAVELLKDRPVFGNVIFDVYLAATALSHGVGVVATDNVKDFVGLGLEVVNPFS